MTTSLADAPSALRGAQRPRVCNLPHGATSSAGPEAVELAAMAGLVLDPWEQFTLEHSLGEREDGLWAAFEVGVEVSRQNGKGAILEARELAGLFLIGERLIIHSAHQFDTSLEAFRRLLELVENTPDFSRRVKRVSRSHGEEGIELLGGQRIRFRTRTRGGGRGFTGDCLILDEAMILPTSAHGALLPTLSARPNPQVWYTGSAVDQTVHEDGIVFSRIRARGHTGHDPRLLWAEWSVDADITKLDDRILDDKELWAQGNPALGIRISVEHIENERRSMDDRTFAVERLGIGDWPNPEEERKDYVIHPDAWATLADRRSEAEDPVCFAFDVAPDRSRSAIGVAGERPDGLDHVEVIDHRAGTSWVVARIAELVEDHECVAEVVCDGSGPAGSLIAPLEKRGIQVKAVTAGEHAQACGGFYDAVDGAGLRHLDTAELRKAIEGAAKRNLGDAWAWSRKNSTVDISPLVAVTLARWGRHTLEPESTFNPEDYRIRRI